MNTDDLKVFYKTDNITKIVSKIGYTTASWHNWIKVGKIPARTQDTIQVITGGKLKADKKTSK